MSRGGCCVIRSGPDHRSLSRAPPLATAGLRDRIVHGAALAWDARRGWCNRAAVSRSGCRSRRGCRARNLGRDAGRVHARTHCPDRVSRCQRAITQLVRPAASDRARGGAAAVDRCRPARGDVAGLSSDHQPPSRSVNFVESTTLPTTSPASSNRCASAASLSGRTRSITGAT